MTNNCECDDLKCEVVIPPEKYEDAGIRRDDLSDPDTIYVVAPGHDEGNTVLYNSEDGWILVRNRKP